MVETSEPAAEPRPAVIEPGEAAIEPDAPAVEPETASADRTEPVVEQGQQSERSVAAAVEPSVEAPRRPQRFWVSGANGFVGKAVVRVLRARGDEVVAPVRSRGRAAELVDMGVTVVEDDLSDVDGMAEQLRDVDAVIHAAGSYRVGIRREERGAMWDANIGTTTRVLDAAEAARTPRIVYVSTVGIFGNTRGQAVDETYRRDVREGFLSWYDETKFGAHEVAAQRARAGAPIVTVLPSQVYGPGDQSTVGAQLRLAHSGKLPYRALDDVGLGFVHVDDLAVGIVAALDRGATSRAYVLSGPRHRLSEAIQIAARLGGQKPPRLRMPTRLLRLLVPVGRFIGQSNLREVIAAGAGVTYWASAERAARELGFSPRSLEDGLRDTFEAEREAAYTRF